MHSNAQQIDNLQVIPQLRSFLRLEVSTATQRKRREGNGEKKDQLEAALSFFFIPQGIRLHQHAESQLIPSYIKTVDPNIPFRKYRVLASPTEKGALHVCAQTWNLRRKQNKGPTVCANETKNTNRSNEKPTCNRNKLNMHD